MSRLRTLGPRVQTLDTRKAKPLEKVANPHYQTPEHKDWALKVKQRAGWRCEYVESGVRCERSAARGDVMYADHIESLRDRPDLALELSNGRCACNSHNTRSGIEARARRMQT